MSTSEKLTIRRRTAAKPAPAPAPVETAVAPQAPAAPVPQTPVETEAPKEVAPKAPEAPKAKISTPKPMSPEQAAQAAQDEVDNQQIAIPSFFQPGAQVRQVDLHQFQNYKPEPIKAAIVLDNPNYKEPEVQEAELAEDAAPSVPEESTAIANEPELAPEADASKERKTSFGERVQTEKLDQGLAQSLASRRPGQRKINEKQFFSEGHKESVIKNNDFVENNQTNQTVFVIKDNQAFLDLINKGESAAEVIEGDNEYAQAASRSVIAAISSYYSVVLLHSGYQANFTGLKYLGKSRLLTSAESLYLDRRRLYETIYNQIESMTGNKPTFEKWLKITSFLDTPSLLFGVYAATFPIPQNFEVTCPKCGNKMQVPTDPESIVAVYDQKAYDRVRDVVNANPSTTEIIKQSALSKIFTVPLEKRQSVFYIKEPSIQDFLDVLAVVTREPELYNKYEDTFEKTMYIDHVMIPDVAHYEREGKVRFVKMTDKKLIVRFLANLEDDEGTAIDDVIENLNKDYNVDYEIPEFTCNGLLKNENGDWTDEPCKEKIAAMHLDMEKILFHYLQRKPAKPKE